MVVTPPQNLCRICAIAAGEGALADYDRPWLQSCDYVALTSVGALVPGWSLVFPKDHCLNLADKLQQDALWQFVDEAHSIVTQNFGRSVIFEHGARHTSSLTGCGTDHAHLHIVPLPFSLISAAVSFDSTIQWHDCRASQIESATQGNEYLFVADELDGLDTHGKVAMLKTGRSQFFRQVIATMLNRPLEYNYRTHPFSEVAVAGANLLRVAAQADRAIAA